MCRFSIDYDWFRSIAGESFASYFASELPRLQQLARDGLIELGTDQLTVTDRGRFLIRIVCMVFDAYLGVDTERFSKAI